MNGLDDFVKQKLVKNKPDIMIRASLYKIWAITLLEKEVGPPEHPNYGWPLPVLDYLRALISEDVKGETWENSYAVPLPVFCQYIVKEK